MGLMDGAMHMQRQTAARMQMQGKGTDSEEIDSKGIGSKEIGSEETSRKERNVTNERTGNEEPDY